METKQRRMLGRRIADELGRVFLGLLVKKKKSKAIPVTGRGSL
jgi:hypothetical protein